MPAIFKAALFRINNEFIAPAVPSCVMVYIDASNVPLTISMADATVIFLASVTIAPEVFATLNWAKGVVAPLIVEFTLPVKFTVPIEASNVPVVVKLPETLKSELAVIVVPVVIK